MVYTVHVLSVLMNDGKIYHFSQRYILGKILINSFAEHAAKLFP